MRFIAGVTTGVVVAFALTAGTATAGQWWVQNGEGKLKQPIPVGETVAVPTTGKVTVKFKAQGRRIVTAQCALNGTETLTNTPTEALGETSALVFSACSAGVALTPILPWSSALQSGPGSPFTDQLSNVALDVSIEGVDYGVLSGSLVATYGDADPPMKDDLDNTLKIKPKSGTLTGPGGTLSLMAQVKYGVKGVDGAAGEPLTFTNGLDLNARALRLEADLAAAAVTDGDEDE